MKGETKMSYCGDIEYVDDHIEAQQEASENELNEAMLALELQENRLVTVIEDRDRRLRKIKVQAEALIACSKRDPYTSASQIAIMRLLVDIVDALEEK